MVKLINHSSARTLYEIWMREHYEDTPVHTYYDQCAMAEVLTHKILKPFRVELIQTVMLYEYDSDNVKILQHLYNEYKDINDPETTDAVLIELYTELIEFYRVPFHAMIRIVDGCGNLIYMTEGEYDD